MRAKVSARLRTLAPSSERLQAPERKEPHALLRPHNPV